MAASFDIVAKLRADSTQFIAGLKAGEVASTKFATSMGGVSQAVAVGAAAAVATAGVMLYKLGASFHDAYKEIRVGTGATGEALADLKQSFNNVFAQTPASMKDVGVVIADLNTKLGLTGAPLENLSLQIIKLSRITGTDLKGNIEGVTTVFKNFSVSASEQKDKLDLLYRTSQTSGVSVATLAQQMASSGLVARQLGFDFDQTAAFVGTLAKSGLEVRDVLPAMTKALATAGKSGQDASVLFAQTFDAIRNAKDPTEATGIALEVFGARGGPKLAAAISEGKLSFDDYMKTIQSGTDTISKSASDVSTVGGKLKVIGHQIQVAFQPLATLVFDGMNRALKLLMPVIEKVTGSIGAMIDAYRALPAPIMLVIPAIAGLVLAIKGFVALQAIVSGMATAVIGAVASMASSAGMFAAQFLAAMGISEAAALQAGVVIQSALGPVMIAVAAAFVVFTLWNQGQQESRKRAKEFADTLDEQTGAWTDNTQKLVENNLANKGLLDRMNEAGISVDRVRAFVEDQSGAWVTQTEATRAANHAQNIMRTSSEAAAQKTQELADAIRNEGGARNSLIADLAEAHILTADLVTQLYDEADAYDKKQKTLEAIGIAQGMANGLDKEAAKANYDQAQANKEAADAIKAKTDALRAATDPVYAALSAQSNLTTAQKNYNDIASDGTKTEQEKNDAAIALTKAYGDYGFALRDLERANLEAGDAGAKMTEYMDMAVKLGLDPAAESTKRTLGAMYGLGSEMGRLAAPSADVKAKMDALKDPLYAASEAGKVAAAQLALMGWQMRDINGTPVWVKVDADTDRAKAALGSLLRNLSTTYRLIADDDQVNDFKRAAASIKAWQYGAMASAYGYAEGGMIRDGMFVVGEQGPEIGIKQGGAVRILSNPQSRQMLADVGGGGGSTNVAYTINVEVSPTTDKAAVGRSIVEAISAFERRSGAGWRA